MLAYNQEQFTFVALTMLNSVSAFVFNHHMCIVKNEKGFKRMCVTTPRGLDSYYFNERKCKVFCRKLEVALAGEREKIDQ